MESGDAIDPGGAEIAIGPGDTDDAVFTQDQIDALADFNIVEANPIVANTGVGNVVAAAPVGNGNVIEADPVIAPVPFGPATFEHAQLQHAQQVLQHDLAVLHAQQAQLAESIVSLKLVVFFTPRSVEFLSQPVTRWVLYCTVGMLSRAGSGFSPQAAPELQ